MVHARTQPTLCRVDTKEQATLTVPHSHQAKKVERMANQKTRKEERERLQQRWMRTRKWLFSQMELNRGKQTEATIRTRRKDGEDG